MQSAPSLSSQHGSFNFKSVEAHGHGVKKANYNVKKLSKRETEIMELFAMQ